MDQMEKLCCARYSELLTIYLILMCVYKYVWSLIDLNRQKMQKNESQIHQTGSNLHISSWRENSEGESKTTLNAEMRQNDE